MNKAFIFDMDGVIINSEPVWAGIEKKFFIQLLGEEIFAKIKGELIGASIQLIYQHATQNGLQMEWVGFRSEYDKLAKQVYKKSELTKDFEQLLELLKSLNFKVGLVTASTASWIDQVLPKLKNPKAFDCILSVIDREDLKPKPSPDGYLEAIKKLGSSPSKTIILEDSNKGLSAAKQSGALTICLREHLPLDYQPQGADLYIDNLSSLIKLLETMT